MINGAADVKAEKIAFARRRKLKKILFSIGMGRGLNGIVARFSG
jgi:hypothetical protein